MWKGMYVNCHRDRFRMSAGRIRDRTKNNTAVFQVEVKCEKTGYHAEIEFLSKPFFGGKPHRIVGSIYKPEHKKPIMTLKGEWNGIIHAKPSHGKEFTFLDVKAKPEVSKVNSIILPFSKESHLLMPFLDRAMGLLLEMPFQKCKYSNSNFLGM